MPQQRFAAFRRVSEYVGCWVALEECVYEGRSATPVDGDVVDHDFDLASLCHRLKERGVSHSAVVRVCQGCESVRPEARRVG
jgi:hypothetical protein